MNTTPNTLEENGAATKAQAMADLESTIRKELGIPDNAQHVLILSMDAHMDWDWQVTFQDYLTGHNSPASAVTDIINSAFALMKGTGPAPTTYYYSICEMGFFEGAVQLNPSLTQNFQAAIGDRLRIVGGGVTSPDNLVPHGEALLRNYLVGQEWMQRTFGLPLRQAYVPDNFGHDSQFPVLVAAMGLMGVSFSRVPGEPNQGPPATLPYGQPTLNDQLVKNGVDFVWQAADGSSVIAHYMQQTYCQGNNIDQGSSALVNIQGYLDANKPSAPTPYIYVPCGCDFALPKAELVNDAASWNSAYFRGRPQDVYAVVATLDHYIQLISTYIDPNIQHNYGPYKNLASMAFFPTPYRTGYYASRIANKILHQAATRALLGAETFAAVADLLAGPNAFGFQGAQERQEAVWSGWKALVPSTHHDYISGTATDAVTTTEQVPLLADTLARGEGARSSAIEQIATQVQTTPKAGEVPVAIFNQLGYGAKGPCTLPPLPGFTPQSIRFEDGSQSPVQIAHDGQYLFLGAAPSLGYQAGYLSADQVTPADTASIDDTSIPGNFTLSNGALSATIESVSAAIIHLMDRLANVDLVPSGIANALKFYIDDGGIYRFGNEYKGQKGARFQIDNGNVESGDCEVLERGPVRVWLRTTSLFTSQDGSASGTYIRDYILVAGEAFLRMTFSGAAPLTAAGAPNSNDTWEGNQYAVMVQFPFVGPDGSRVAIDNLTFGTPYYWVTQMPLPYWDSPIFQAMHDYLLPQASDSVLAAIYQSTIPGWAVDADGALIGCLLRNTPRDRVDSHGANGEDTGTHTHHYALRVPSGIQDPKTGAQLQESRAFTTPLRAAHVNVPPEGNVATPKFPATFSLASVAPSSAIITAAKRGTYDPSSLIFRIYQPTTKPVDVTVTLASQITNPSGVEAQLVTALETAIEGSQPVPINNSTVAFPVPLALATLRVGPGALATSKPAAN